MPERPDNGSSPEPGALTVAVRDALNFDRRAVSIQGGLLAAIPVAAVLALGTVVWSSVAGVTMGAGAMLVGIAWRLAGGRPPLALLATDATVMAMSTFVGCLTGSIPWLHFALLAVWALAGGLLVALGSRGGVIGNQAMIAFVVFGRFSEPAAASLGLAGLVLAGGFAQVLFQSIVRWPTPLRWQRTATADAYRALAGLARATVETSTLPVAQALDAAQASLSSSTLLGDPALMTLRSLVNEGLRMRIQLSTVHSLMSRRSVAGGDGAGGDGAGGDGAKGDGARGDGAKGDGADPPDQGGARILELAAVGLDLAARAIEGDRAAAAELPAHMERLSSDTAEHALTPAVSGLALSRRLSALAGQLRAIGSLAVAAGKASGLRDRRPRARTSRPFEQVRTDLATLRANASLQSPAGRHAVRLAVVVLLAELISQHLPLSRSYWMVVAAATTLRPEFGATFTRGVERAGGTALGAGLAGLIAVALHPAGGVTVLLVGLLAWAGYSVLPASFALGFAFITAVVVFLLNAIAPDTLATAWARLLDTLVGGTLGLLAYALWPTWSYVSARQSLADLVEAERAYVRPILAVIADGRRPDDQEMRSLSRHVRLTRTTTEANVARSLSEPATRRIDAEQSQGSLAAARRLVLAAHVLRLDAQDQSGRPPLPALAPLAADLDSLLRTVDATLRAGPDPPEHAPVLPDLRADYEELERVAPKDPDSAAVLVELDEIVDSANGLAALAGLEAVDDEAAAPRS